jgi:hypothetical protein
LISMQNVAARKLEKWYPLSLDQKRIFGWGNTKLLSLFLVLILKVKWIVWFHYVYMKKNASQIYMLHGFVPNPCEICYFMGLYHLHMNAMHYLNKKVMCMTFVCKQYE